MSRGRSLRTWRPPACPTPAPLTQMLEHHVRIPQLAQNVLRPLEKPEVGGTRGSCRISGDLCGVPELLGRNTHAMQRIRLIGRSDSSIDSRSYGCGAPPAPEQNRARADDPAPVCRRARTRPAAACVAFSSPSSSFLFASRIRRAEPTRRPGRHGRAEAGLLLSRSSVSSSLARISCVSMSRTLPSRRPPFRSRRAILRVTRRFRPSIGTSSRRRRVAIRAKWIADGIAPAHTPQRPPKRPEAILRILLHVGGGAHAQRNVDYSARVTSPLKPL